MVDVTELEWNLKRLIRDGFPKDGLPLTDFPAEYKKYFKIKMTNPSKYQPGCQDWISLFRKNLVLKSSFRISKNSRNNEYMIKVLPKPQENLKVYLRLVDYMSYLSEKSRQSQILSSSDDDDSDESGQSEEEEEVENGSAEAVTRNEENQTQNTISDSQLIECNTQSQNTLDSESQNSQSSLDQLQSSIVASQTEHDNNGGVGGSGSCGLSNDSQYESCGSSSSAKTKEEPKTDDDDDDLNQAEPPESVRPHVSQNKDQPCSSKPNSNDYVEVAQIEFNNFPQVPSATVAAAAQLTSAGPNACSNSNLTFGLKAMEEGVRKQKCELPDKMMMTRPQAQPKVEEQSNTPCETAGKVPDEVQVVKDDYSPCQVGLSYSQFKYQVLTELKERNPRVLGSKLLKVVDTKWAAYLKQTHNVVDSLVVDLDNVPSAALPLILPKQAATPTKDEKDVVKPIFVIKKEVKTEVVVDEPIAGPSTRVKTNVQEESEPMTQEEPRISEKRGISMTFSSDKMENSSSSSVVKRFKVPLPSEEYEDVANDILAISSAMAEEAGPEEKFLTMRDLSAQMSSGPSNWVIFHITDSMTGKYGKPQRGIYRWDKDHEFSKLCPIQLEWKNGPGVVADLNLPEQTILFGEKATIHEGGKKQNIFSVMDCAMFGGYKLMELPFQQRWKLCSELLRDRMSKPNTKLTNTAVRMKPYIQFMEIDNIFNNIAHSGKGMGDPNYNYTYVEDPTTTATDKEVQRRTEPIHGLLLMKVQQQNGSTSNNKLQGQNDIDVDKLALPFLGSMGQVWYWPFQTDSCFAKENLLSGETVVDEIGWWSFREIINKYSTSK